ncbi:MAG: regulatory protein RecX [Candidatus Omnitrophota bacterium]
MEVKESSKKKDIASAKEYIFRVLKVRMYASFELIRKLEQRGYNNKIIKEVLRYFKGLGFVDDKQFTRLWLSSRLKKPLGFRRLKFELKRKGIKEELVESSVKKLKKDYDEYSVVKHLTIQRLKRLKGLEPLKIKKRLFSYLVGRGFSLDVIIEVLAGLSKLKEAENTQG